GKHLFNGIARRKGGKLSKLNRTVVDRGQGLVVESGRNHAVEQAGKTAFEVFAPQGSELAGADRLGPGDAGLAQLGEVIAEIGLRGQVEEHRAVHRRLAARQFAHDGKPRRVAQGDKHVR